TLPGASVFSSGFQPRWAGPPRNIGQLTLTVNAEAASPLCATALTGCQPGCADRGTSNPPAKAPRASAKTCQTRVRSKSTSTVSPARKPEPLIRTLAPGGPDVGASATPAEAARARSFAPSARAGCNANDGATINAAAKTMMAVRIRVLNISGAPCETACGRVTSKHQTRQRAAFLHSLQ